MQTYEYNNLRVMVDDCGSSHSICQRRDTQATTKARHSIQTGKDHGLLYQGRKLLLLERHSVRGKEKQQMWGIGMTRLLILAIRRSLSKAKAYKQIAFSDKLKEKLKKGRSW